MHKPPKPSVFISEYELDPDEPVESIEQAAIEIKETQPRPGNSQSKPSAHCHLHEGSPLTDQINESMDALRIGTPTEATTAYSQAKNVNHVERAGSSTSPQLETPRSSQNLTPDLQARSNSLGSSNDVPGRISDSVIRDFDSLRIQKDTPYDSHSHKRSGSNSGTPSRRRRSRSAVEKEIYRVETEELPSSLSHMKKTEAAFAQARSLAQAFGVVLTGSGRNQNDTSSIRRLQQDAVKFSRLEPPSKQIIGFVGDSGVGKSSLINSLLDRKDFARSVSYSWTRFKVLH